MKRFLKILRFAACTLVGIVLLVLVTSIGTGIYLIGQTEDEAEQSQAYSFVNINEVYAMNPPEGYNDNLLLGKSWTILDTYLDSDDKILTGTWKIDKTEYFHEKKKIVTRVSHPITEGIDSCDFSFTFYENKSYAVKSGSKKIGCDVPMKKKQYWDVAKNKIIINYDSKVVIKKLVTDTMVLVQEITGDQGKSLAYVTFVRRK